MVGIVVVLLVPLLLLPLSIIVRVYSIVVIIIIGGDIIGIINNSTCILASGTRFTGGGKAICDMIINSSVIVHVDPVIRIVVITVVIGEDAAGISGFDARAGF